MFWAIVMLSNRAACWKRKPKRIRWRVNSRSLSSARFRPSKQTLPRAGRNRPMIVFSSTVLPQPLSPMTATVWPRESPG